MKKKTIIYKEEETVVIKKKQPAKKYHNLTKEEIAEICRLYETDKYTLQEIAEIVKRAPSTVARIVREYSNHRKRNPSDNCKITKEEIAEMCRLYETDEYTIQEIARITKRALGTVGKIVREYSNHRRRNPNFTEKECQEIFALYNNGVPIWKICESYGSSRGTIDSLIKREKAKEVLEIKNKVVKEEKKVMKITEKEKSSMIDFYECVNYVNDCILQDKEIDFEKFLEAIAPKGAEYCLLKKIKKTK